MKRVIMRRVVSLLFVCFISIFSRAATNITVPNVSGVWNVSGSPYYIQVNITVPANQTLLIQPGVEVIFNDIKNMSINGTLVAKGTAAQPIVFKSVDTTGWSIENMPNGGWNGIHFMSLNGNVIDSSAFEYCIVQDCKYGYNNLQYNVNPFYVNRKLKIKNCTFFHNNTGTGMNTAGNAIELNTNVGDTIEFSNCQVYENTSIFGIVRVNNFMGGYANIHHNHLHHNHLGATLWGSWVNLLFEYNEVDSNNTRNDSSPFKMSIGKAIVRYNKIHHNECDQLAAIGCRSGQVEIDNNFIYNNHQKDGSCGATGGGGAIHLAHNEGGADFANTFYKVRNNIIVNNRSEFGGGAIYVYHAKADICNNTIVGNSALILAQAIGIWDPASEVKIKNNLFYGQRINTPSPQDSFVLVGATSANKIYFDYNFIHAPFYKTVYGNYNTLLGDTTHNVIAMNPKLTNPTPNNLLNTNASLYTFDILAGSLCIDAGDTAGAWALPFDYAGNLRIMNKIDIGAYEFVKSAESVFDIEMNEISFTISPNPASDILFFEPQNVDGKLQVNDMQGRIVYQETMRDNLNIIDISKWGRGIYILNYFFNNHKSSTKLSVK